MIIKKNITITSIQEKLKVIKYLKKDNNEKDIFISIVIIFKWNYITK